MAVTFHRFVLVSCTTFMLFLCQTTGIRAQSVQSGNIEVTLSEIVATIPGMGSNSFVIPSSSQISTFESVFTELKAKNFTNVQNLIEPFGYSLVLYKNLPTNDTLYILKENLPLQRGWGTYICNFNTSNDLAIEVPHPLWDRYSWSLGMKAFLGTKAKVFIMAGTHRYANADSSSDMAHETKSIFHTAHRIYACATSIQVHGFDGSTTQYAGYPDLVISNGTLYPSSVYYSLRDNYTVQGFTGGVFSYATYNQLKLLGATTNTQGAWSNNNNKRFVHIEHDQPLRYDTTKQRKCAQAIINTFGVGVGVLPEKNKMSPTLLKAYPNPFNPVTKISFELSQADEILLTIYDVLGNKIQDIHQGYLPAGEHSFQFQAEHLVSSVYICRLSSSKWTKTTKLILLK